MANMRYPLILAAIAATGLSTAAATASDASENRQRLVEYSDLDLSTAAGQQALTNRVNRAVNAVCNFPQARTMAEHNDKAQCKARARTIAMREVGQTIARHGGKIKIAAD